VLWSPPITNWMKVNTDGALIKNPHMAAYGGIFRDCNNFCHGWFAENITTYSPFIGEITASMKAIKIAAEMNWNNLWLETDSQLVLFAFKFHNMVPWYIGNRWINCLHTVTSMNFLVSHIYREGPVHML